MRNDPGLPDGSGPDEGPQTPLPAIDHTAGSFHDVMSRFLDLAIEARDWGGIEGVTGWDLVQYLTHEARLPSWLAAQVASVAERIEAVPHVADRFRADVVTFDQLAAFVRVTSERNGDLLARLDEEAASLADHLAETHRLHAWVDEITVLVEDLRAAGHLRRQERRRARGERVSLQTDLDGGGRLIADLDKLSLATVCAAFEHAGDHTGRSRGRRWAGALTAVCADALGGTTDSGNRRPARPLVVLHVDVADATADRFGHLLHVAAGQTRLPVLSARAAELLTRHADLVVQLRDGRNPLAEIKDGAEDIPRPIRRAVRNRDRGCRGPGCTRPIEHLHHIVHRVDGGDHDPTNIIGACTPHHLWWVHRLGTQPTLEPTSGRVTWTLPNGRRIATMPHGHRPAPFRDPALLADWQAPPRSPPPDHLEPGEPDRTPGSWLDPPPDLHTLPGRDPP